MPPTTRPKVFLSWLGGLATDIVQFALFLLVGLAAINILIASLVLVVGFFQSPQIDFEMIHEKGELAEKLAKSTHERHITDAIDLGIALAAAAAAGAGYHFYRRVRRKYLHLFMGTGFESFVSKRYLIAREGGRLVGLITTVSVLGVAVGVMALIVVLGVMQGFDRELVKKFMGVFSHIQIMTDRRQGMEPEMPHGIYTRIMEKVAEEPFVKGVSPIFDYQTIVQKNRGDLKHPAFALIRGIDPKTEGNVTEFMNYVVDGKSVPGKNEVVLGERLAETLGVFVGDDIYVLGKIVETANHTAAKTVRLRIVGIFRSGLYDVDNQFMYTTIETVQGVRVTDDVVTSIHMRVDDPQAVREYGQRLIPLLPRGYGVLTWQRLNPQFFEALWMEKVAMFIILLLIVLVAALNIIGTLVMTVVQKTRDIGVLKSMGAGNGMILRIFLAHGFLIGLLGTSLGVVWGLRICQFVHNDIEKIFRLPAGVYGIDRLPVVVEPPMIILMAGSAMTICILASIIPAYQAARLNPVEALRYD